MGFKKKAREAKGEREKKIAKMQKKLIAVFEEAGGEVVGHNIVLDSSGNPTHVPHMRIPASKVRDINRDQSEEEE